MRPVYRLLMPYATPETAAVAPSPLRDLAILQVTLYRPAALAPTRGMC